MNSPTSDSTPQKSDRVEFARTNAGPAVMSLIRMYDGISRTELARRTHMSAQAISKIVARLVAEGLVWESGRQSVGVGKARTRLSIIPQARFAIGILLSRTEAFICIVNLGGEIKASTSFKYVSVPSGQETADLLADAINNLLATDESMRRKIVGCGIGMPGPVDLRTGIATAPNNFAGWRDVPFAEMMSKRIGVPTAIDKDTNMVMLSEHWQTPHEGWNVVIYIGSGIGAAWTIDGEVYRGSNSNSGEFGHTTILPNGPLCVCGRYGCVEVFASPAAVVQKYKTAKNPKGDHPNTAAWNSKTAQEVAEIAELARRGDSAAREALYESGHYLGISAANLVTLLDISHVTFAGPMVDVLGSYYLRGIEDGFSITETDPQQSAKIYISSDLKTEQIARGAAFLFLNFVGI